MASKRNNVGASIGGTVAAAGAIGILGWWWWVYMAEADKKVAKRYGATPSPQLHATVVEDEQTADQLAAEAADGPTSTPAPQVPTISLGGA